MRYRQSFLKVVAGCLPAVLAVGAAFAADRAEPQAAKPKVLRDLFWVWDTPRRAVPGDHTFATFTQASAAQKVKLLGAPNVVMAGAGIPNDDRQADAWTKAVGHCPRMVWEISPDSSKDGLPKPPFVYKKRVEQIQKLSEKYHQIEGVMLDDMSSHGITNGFTPEQLRQLRGLLDENCPQVKIWGVLYTMNFKKPELVPLFKETDVINLWVWHARDLVNMEEYITQCEKTFPGKPIVLGLYMYDYGIRRRMTKKNMMLQCEAARKLAHQGRIKGIVFLTIDEDEEIVSWTADWIKRVGDEPLGRPTADGRAAVPVRPVSQETRKPEDAGLLRIGDGGGWQFVDSKWSDCDGGGITGSRIGDGDGLQGYCFAFAKDKSYRDLEAAFTVKMPTGHADIGLIVRAQDPKHYYLIHFPQCGQAYRAQHFWAALSVADGSGWLRLLKVAHVPRVASNPFGISHKARVKLTGDRIQVWINGHPALDVKDSTYKEGRVGLAGFASFAHGRVTVDGEEVPASPWNSRIGQVKNWFIPFPQVGGGQGEVSLAKAGNGDILSLFTGGGTDYLARSSDKGVSWTAKPAPQNVRELRKEDNYKGNLIHTADGRLLVVSLSSEGGAWTESKDHGLTWSKPAAIDVSGWPGDPKKLVTGYPFTLRDGTLMRFGLGLHSTSTAPITKWGAVHCQAFSTRSSDGGKIWSVPANLDATARGDMGNLDLTEPVGFETKDGKIMCLIRPVYSPWMWETWSSDKGKTWGPCVRGPFPGWAPSSPVRTVSGLVMFPTRFPGLTMHHTRDEGMIWDDGGGGTYLDTSIWAMGSLLEVEPNVVLFIYMDSWKSKLRAQFIRVTEKGLEPARELIEKAQAYAPPPPPPEIPPSPQGLSLSGAGPLDKSLDVTQYHTYTMRLSRADPNGLSPDDRLEVLVDGRKAGEFQRRQLPSSGEVCVKFGDNDSSLRDEIASVARFQKVAVVPGQAEEGEGAVVYSADGRDASPEAQDWARSFRGESVKAGEVKDAQSSAWEITTPAGTRIGYVREIGPQVYADPRGWTLTARCRVASQSNPGSCSITLADGRNAFAMMLGHRSN